MDEDMAYEVYVIVNGALECTEWFDDLQDASAFAIQEARALRKDHEIRDFEVGIQEHWCTGLDENGEWYEAEECLCSSYADSYELVDSSWLEDDEEMKQHTPTDHTTSESRTS